MPRAKVRKLLPSQNARPIMLACPPSVLFQPGDIIPRSYYVVGTANPAHREVYQRAFWSRQEAGIAANFDYEKAARVVVMTGAQILKHIKEAGLADPTSSNTDT